MRVNLDGAIQRNVALVLVETYINHAGQGKDRLQGGTHFFYSHDFGNIFEMLGWDKECRIEVEVRWTPRERRKQCQDT